MDNDFTKTPHTYCGAIEHAKFGRPELLCLSSPSSFQELMRFQG
jgi:hypothetical protein